ARDVDVDEHEVGRIADGEADALEAVDGVDDLVAHVLEELSHQEPVRRVVLDVEDPRHSERIRARLGERRKVPKAKGCLPRAETLDQNRPTRPRPAVSLSGTKGTGTTDAVRTSWGCSGMRPVISNPRPAMYVAPWKTSPTFAASSGRSLEN